MASSTTNLTASKTIHPLAMNKPCLKFCVSPGAGRLQGVLHRCPVLRCTTLTTAEVIEQQPDQKVITRRSGNYEAPLWSFDHIQSLDNGYSGDKYVRRANELKEKVKLMLREDKDMQLLDCLELVDNLERLGLSYHFEGQIYTVLSGAYNNGGNSSGPKRSKEDLYAAALEFRVFREHGFHVPQGTYFLLPVAG